MEKRDIWNRANQLVEQNRPDAALPELWKLVDRSHVVDEELHTYLALMARVYGELQRPRAAATALLYLGRTDAAERVSDHPIDQARCKVQRRQLVEAAKDFASAGWLGHAAIQLEEAGDHRGARVLWSRLADDPRMSTAPYTHGLVRFNLGRACARLGDSEAARKATVQSMHLLEAAADGFETRGLRERAFDCFQVLLALGKDGAFENLAEGYLNCIRILKEDNLKYYVLQYFEDFQELALERGELHAAATLFREAAQFSRRHNLQYERHYRERAAQTQVAAAEKMLADGQMPEMAENAYAAAIDLFNDLGSYSQVRAVYAQLAQLDLGDKRRARYVKLHQRLADVPDEAGKSLAFPNYLRMDTAYPQIWRLDVIEWEQGGDAAETMGEVLQDAKWPNFTRRRALLCRLHQLGSGETHLTPATLVGLANHLGRVEIYAALSPLEHLVEHEDARVRAACLRAVRSLFFKRSFGLVMRGLEDEHGDVRKEALDAVSALHFGHAFDPLQRIYRTSGEPVVRRAALTSIGRIASIDAAEMLVDVLRQGDPDERTLVRDLLTRAEQPEVTGLLKRAVTAETGPVKRAMQEVLAARGE